MPSLLDVFDVIKTEDDCITFLAHQGILYGTWNGLKMHIKPRNRTREGISEHLMEFIWRRKHDMNDLWKSFIDAIREIHYDIE